MWGSGERPLFAQATEEGETDPRRYSQRDRICRTIFGFPNEQSSRVSAAPRSPQRDLEIDLASSISATCACSPRLLRSGIGAGSVRYQARSLTTTTSALFIYTSRSPFWRCIPRSPIVCSCRAPGRSNERSRCLSVDTSMPAGNLPQINNDLHATSFDFLLNNYFYFLDSNHYGPEINPTFNCVRPKDALSKCPDRDRGRRHMWNRSGGLSTTSF